MRNARAGRPRSSLEHLWQRIKECGGGKSGIFLEIFSGVGRIAQCLRFKKEAAIGLDVLDDPMFDMSKKCLCHAIRLLIRAGVIRGIFLAPPCTTWSIACKPAVRNINHLYGLDDVPAHRQQGVKIGNDTFLASVSIIKCCLSHGVPVMIENPDTSMMFKVPILTNLTRDQSWQEHRFTMCGFGARWRKATKVWSWNCGSIHLPRMCASRTGVCDFTGQFHIRLAGHDKSSGKCWTSIASAYPMPMAKVFATALCEASCDAKAREQLEIISSSAGAKLSR